MAILRTDPMDITQFAMVRQNGGWNLVTELSDLGPQAFDRLYDDACDIGLTVRTARGNLVSFYLAETKRDAEGETQAYTMHAIPEDVRRFPEAARMMITVLND